MLRLFPNPYFKSSHFLERAQVVSSINLKPKFVYINFNFMNHQNCEAQYYKYLDSPFTSYCTSDTSSSMASTVVTTDTLSSSIVIYDDEDVLY